MISHWTSPEGQAAIEKMGPVTWDASLDGSPHEATLTPPVIGTAWGGKCSCGLDDTLHQRVALALLRDHAREWLLERDLRATPYAGPIWRVWRYFKTRDRWFVEDGPPFADYDEALIAAVNAADETT